MKTDFIFQYLLTFLVFSSQFSGGYRPDQAAFELTDLVVYYSFAESINFDARITPADNISEIKEIYINIMPDGQSSSFELVNWDGSETIHFMYDASGLGVMPFSDIQYQFLFVLDDKTEISTPILLLTTLTTALNGMNYSTITLKFTGTTMISKSDK